MTEKFDISERVILLILFSTFIVRLSLPGIKSLEGYVVYIQLFLFILFIIIKFDFRKTLEFIPNKLIILDKFLLISFFLFLFSVFVVNYSTSINIPTFLKLISYLIVVSCFFYYFPKILFYNTKKFDAFIDYLFYISIFLISIGILFWLIGFNSISEYSETTTGLFAHPNTTSMFLTIAVPVIVYKFFSQKISGVFFIIILSLALISLLFTYSRAGYIGVGVGLLIYTFNKSKKLFVFISILIIIISSTIVYEFATMKTDSSLSRVLLMYASISMITENQTFFLWGYGPVNAYQVFNVEKFFFGDEDVMDPHNVFLLLAIQFGVLFTIFITISFFTLLFKIIKLKLHNVIHKDNHRLNLSITIVVSLLIQNILEDMIIYPEVFFMPIFLIFSGILYYSYRSKINIL